VRRLVLLALLLPATSSAAPARLGDFSLGAGPALVIDRGDAGAGAVAEANLLWRWFSLGLHGRAAAVDGDFRPAGGIEFGALGLFGLGASIQAPGPSLDALLQVPVPIYAWKETYLALAWRPSWLVREEGGWIHTVSLQLKWSSLLVPTED
jgi:hypothetical protein